MTLKDVNFAPTFPGPFEICSATRVDLYIVPFHSLKIPDVTAKQSKASYCQQQQKASVPGSLFTAILNTQPLVPLIVKY